MANVIRFDDEAKEKMRQKLKKDKNIKVILGYASGLESFVNYLEAKGDSADMFSVKVIFADSDTLKETVKSKLEAIFGCPVVDRYSNEEQGLMACTNAHNPGFILNTASYHFELLKLDKDEQARPGEIGRLVVTDLYNRSMPFIRYDTGDLGVSYDTGSLKTLSELHGRVADALQDTKGSMVSASLVNNFFHHLYKIKQYQLIQNGEKNYELKVVCEKDDYAESELINTCRAFLGEEASVAVRYAFRIPAEENGKFKTTVSRYGHKSKTEDLCAR
jgi:phenylacetate-CoA ligase